MNTQSSSPIKNMQELLTAAKDKVVPFRAGETTEVTILHKTRQRILVDVAGVTLGIIPVREFSFDTDELQEGTKTLAYVLSAENEDGYTILSLKRADRERLWKTLEQKQANGEPVKIKITAANRGGLMVEYAGVEGFMPVSQLAPEHYPKVEGGDSQEILSRLKAFVDQTLTAKIITVDRANSKLIFSEKAIGDQRIVTMIQSIKPGQKFTGKVVGIVDFGLFVKIPYQDELIEGLVHLSEVAWDRVDDLKSHYAIGNEVDVVVIGAEKTKLSLSIKRLQPDPWETIKDKYQTGNQIKGEITRITPFGAFVHLPEGVEALIHLSELPIEKKEDIQKILKVGESYAFRIASVEPEARKINLSMKPTDTKKPSSKKSSTSKTTKKTTKSKKSV